MTFKVTPEIKKEIEQSISELDNLIKREMAISVDLRKHDKIMNYTSQIINLQKALNSGIL